MIDRDKDAKIEVLKDMINGMARRTTPSRPQDLAKTEREGTPALQGEAHTELECEGTPKPREGAETEDHVDFAGS